MMSRLLVAAMAATFAGSRGGDLCFSLQNSPCPTGPPTQNAGPGTDRCAAGFPTDARGIPCVTRAPTPPPHPGTQNPWLCLPDADMSPETSSVAASDCLASVGGQYGHRDTALAAFLANPASSGPNRTGCNAVPNSTLRSCFTPCEYAAVLCHRSAACRPYLTVPAQPPSMTPPPTANGGCEWAPGTPSLVCLHKLLSRLLRRCP